MRIGSAYVQIHRGFDGIGTLIRVLTPGVSLFLKLFAIIYEKFSF